MQDEKQRRVQYVNSDNAVASYHQFAAWEIFSPEIAESSGFKHL